MTSTRNSSPKNNNISGMQKYYRSLSRATSIIETANHENVLPLLPILFEWNVCYENYYKIFSTGALYTYSVAGYIISNSIILNLWE